MPIRMDTFSPQNVRYRSHNLPLALAYSKPMLRIHGMMDDGQLSTSKICAAFVRKHGREKSSSDGGRYCFRNDGRHAMAHSDKQERTQQHDPTKREWKTYLEP